ncbi:sporulation integral membrane protein YlbJ [Lutibacter sp. B2]|nr:sporulation integral membrane protein YlbJ [Lutibacter sp. B2]
MLFYIKKIFIIFIILFLVIAAIIHPQEAFDSAKSGVYTWLNIIFPALLPFFIGSELLIQLGFVRFIGFLLEPLFRPIFNVPGEGSFIFAMSVTSGYPMGVKMITELRNDHTLNKHDAQRLLSFCSTSGPLFITGAVAIGMFNNVQLGVIIALSHYLGAIITGLFFRCYKNKSILNAATTKQKQGFFKKIFENSNRSNQPFGLLFANSVKKSIETLMQIGGFIILFSVIIRLLTTLGLVHFLSSAITLLPWISFPNIQILDSLISGFFEITVGCKSLSEIHNISFIQQALFSTILISWSGLSIHAQSASLIAKTDLSFNLYLVSKLFHSLFSGMLVIILIPIMNILFYNFHLPVFLNHSNKILNTTLTYKFIFSTKLFILINLSIIFISLLFYTFFTQLNHFKHIQK